MYFWQRPSFWRGFEEGFALLPLAFMAFAAVIRRGLIKGDQDIVMDCRQFWWTEAEKQERAKAAFDRIFRDAK